MIFLKGEAMSTIIRPELSVKNKYYIEKHRYYELRHFCLQYPIWKKTLSAIGNIKYASPDISSVRIEGGNADPTADLVQARIFYSDRISMVEKVAAKTDSEIAAYLLRGVTEGVAYEYLKSKLNIPCCREKYYELYRKFFYLLSIARQ